MTLTLQAVRRIAMRRTTRIAAVVVVLLAGVAGARWREHALAAAAESDWRIQLGMGVKRAASDAAYWIDERRSDGEFAATGAWTHSPRIFSAATDSALVSHGLDALLRRPEQRAAWYVPLDTTHGRHPIAATRSTGQLTRAERANAVFTAIDGTDRIVALPAGRDGSLPVSFVTPVRTAQNVGAIVFRVDGIVSLRRLLSWGGNHAASGQTVLVRRGVDILANGLTPNPSDTARMRVLSWAEVGNDPSVRDLTALMAHDSISAATEMIGAMAPIAGTDWLVFRRVGRAVIDGDAGQQSVFEALVIALGLLVAVIALALAVRVTRGRAEAEVRTILRSIPEIVLVFASDGRCLRVRGAAQGMAAPANRLAGRLVHDVFPRDKADAVLRAIREALELGRTVEFEHSLLVDGRPRWFQALITPLTSASVLWVARDVTESHASADQLGDRERHYRLLFNNHPTPMWIFDTETRRFLEVNRAAEARYGWTADEFRAMTIYDIRPIDAHPELETQLARPSTGIDTRTYRHMTKSGSLLYVEIASDDIIVDGRKARLVSAADVTERIHAEQAVRVSERRLATALSAARMGLWESDLTTGAVTFNDEWETLLGYPSAEIGGDLAWWDQLIHPADIDEVRRKRIAHLTGETDTYDSILRLRRKDGRWVWIHTSARVADRDASGRALRLIGTGRDVTAQRALEDLLRQSQKMEAVGQLAGGIAHDFNNLLTVITANAELLLGVVGPSSPLTADIEEMARAADRGARLTRQLLAFSRQNVMRPEVLELNGVVRELGGLLRRLIGEDVKLDLSLCDRTPTVFADRGQLEQVIINLAVNARDAMPSGGTIRIATSTDRVSPSAYDPAAAGGPVVCLLVSDTGHGMDEATRARIFEPFFTTKPVGQGTGLGLATVYGIVRQSDGSIDVESAPGLGSTFSVRLPACAAELCAAVSDPMPDTSDIQPRATVLLVEDEPSVRSIVARILHRGGHTVIEAANGLEALRVTADLHQHIDLVVTDVIMPDMGGPAMIEELRRRRPGIRTLFISGYTAGQLEQRGALPPGADILLKPFGPQDLTERINAAIAMGRE